jgi:hypothetical protein
MKILSGEAPNFTGIVIGFGAFFLIGILHPVVIKAEYYFGRQIWPLFLASGALCIFLSVLAESSVLSALLSVLGFSLLWGIRELFEQEQRVKKGWFPENPNRKEKENSKEKKK